MNFQTPRFSPSQVQEHCGIYPSTLRDWRSRDFSKHIGTVGDNGRWKYSAIDMVELSIANLATRSGIEGYLAFKAARDCAPIAFRYWGAPVDPLPKRFACFWRSHPVSQAVPINEMFEWDRFDDLSSLTTESIPVAFVFDGKSFAEDYSALGDFLREAMK